MCSLSLFFFFDVVVLFVFFELIMAMEGGRNRMRKEIWSIASVYVELASPAMVCGIRERRSGQAKQKKSMFKREN